MKRWGFPKLKTFCRDKSKWPLLLSMLFLHSRVHSFLEPVELNKKNLHIVAMEARDKVLVPICGMDVRFPILLHEGLKIHSPPAVSFRLYQQSPAL